MFSSSLLVPRCYQEPCSCDTLPSLLTVSGRYNPKLPNVLVILKNLMPTGLVVSHCLKFPQDGESMSIWDIGRLRDLDFLDLVRLLVIWGFT